MTSTVTPSISLVGYQARASDGATVLGEIEGVRPNAVRIQRTVSPRAAPPSARGLGLQTGALPRTWPTLSARPPFAPPCACSCAAESRSRGPRASRRNASCCC